MEELNYQQDLAIDPHSLEEEWLLQPALYMKYAALAAQAQRTSDEAKEQLEVVRAKADLKIRQDPGSFGAPKDKSGEPKTTEGWIAATILLQDEYQKAIGQVNTAKFQLNILTAAVRAFDHRKKALEMEVQLWQGGYFSVPNEKKSIPGAKRLLTPAEVQSPEKQREALDESRAMRRKRGGE